MSFWEEAKMLLRRRVLGVEAEAEGEEAEGEEAEMIGSEERMVPGEWKAGGRKEEEETGQIK